MFEDIGLDKCATTNKACGKLQTNEENGSISDTEELKILDTDDHYKFLRKYENSAQLEQQVCNEATNEYLQQHLHTKRSTCYQDLCLTDTRVPHLDN